jgi:1,4-dihydroxy-6-naphthoate synthase
VHLEDVQTLNNWAKADKLNISKISYGVLPFITNKYVVLDSGGALGKGVGPLLIAKNNAENVDVDNAVIAIPGENTTAHFLFSLAYPNAKNKVFKVFNEIEDFVLSGKGLGVIIHENRFTYQAKGLHKITDLGDYWERVTGAPIPLGGIVAQKNLPADLIEKVNRLIRKSIEFAFENYKENLPDYIIQHSQEMSEEVMRRHINLYVNNYSVSMGEEGRKAVDFLMKVFKEHSLNNTTMPSKNFFRPA